MHESVTIARLDAPQAQAALPQLAEVLLDCVHGGASVSFMAPLSADKALAFWQGVADGVGRGERVLLVAQDAGGEIVGTVQLVLQPDLPRIMGDPALLRQVVHNLVQNALDAVGEHPPADAAPRVLLRTDVSLTDGGEVRAVRLAVRDNGPGFPEQVIKRAFEPYITTKAKGTGLGLAVVKKIADDHGARIAIANQVVDGVVQGAQVSLSFNISATTRALDASLSAF